jgi:glycosyltransferase involved in cell wall biosynthesis
VRRLDARSILIIVQNLPLPGDRRVWLECQALIDAGYRVSAITPKAEGDPAYEFLDGVHLYKYDVRMATGSVMDFIREFAICWIRTSLLAIRVFRAHKFSVIQACNPPDTYWLLALIFRALGIRFVFDQHDLCPELFESRFRGRCGLLYRALLTLERLTYLTADHTIVTNESYRNVAIRRGALAAEKVTVVRTGPDPEALRRSPPSREGDSSRRFIAAYVGVMGPQDGVDLVIRAADHVVNRMQRSDIHFALAGSGDCWQELVDLRDSLGLSGAISMPGRVTDDELFSLLSHADVGLSPDPPGPLNDVSTMNKTMEYMSFGLPVLAFPLLETKVSAADSALYVEGLTAEAYGEALIALIDDPAARAVMGSRGRQRVVDVLAWQHQRDAYVNVFDRLLFA